MTEQPDALTMMSNVLTALQGAPATPEDSAVSISRPYDGDFRYLQGKYDTDVLLEAKVAFWVGDFDLEFPQVHRKYDLSDGEEGFYEAMRYTDDIRWFERQISESLPALVAYGEDDAMQWYQQTVSELERRDYTEETAEDVLSSLNTLGEQIRESAQY